MDKLQHTKCNKKYYLDYLIDCLTGEKNKCALLIYAFDYWEIKWIGLLFKYEVGVKETCTILAKDLAAILAN